MIVTWASIEGIEIIERKSNKATFLNKRPGLSFVVGAEGYIILVSKLSFKGYPSHSNTGEIRD